MSTTEKPTVLIVGAGLGGLMLGALLESCNIPYLIFERAAAVKHLGSALSLSSPLLPLFEQLGIFEKCETVAKPFSEVALYRESKGLIKVNDHAALVEYTGYKKYIISRPVLYDLIREKVPGHKIHFSKRVLTISESNNKVTIQTADDCVYTGDILVGADGAYSTIREQLYEILKKERRLPESDKEDLFFTCTSLVGQTGPLDPEEFPCIKETECEFNSTLADGKPYSWAMFTTAQNTICWIVARHLDAASSKAAEEERLKNNENSEWGPNAAQSMCDETRHFRLPIDDGKWTLGDMFDRTPKDLISKVMLEEKVFETWYSGRTVLLGDACHKLHPLGGHGAVTAMHDALALANLIYALPNSSSEEIHKTFAEYKAERMPLVLESFKNSQILAKSMDTGFWGTVAVFVSTCIPKWLWNIFSRNMAKNRPQAGWLPQIPSKGTIPAVVSPSTEKARAVFENTKGAQGV
ncbi:hypothetical protein BGX23_003117 [Mortierella sp. AD031]|nr:hypothetical protein BGX23_003117 [Mortierella sp. AD031]